MSNVYYMHWEIGSHTAFHTQITPTISEGICMGMRTIQFFMGDPKSAWKRQQIDDEDIHNTNILLSRFPINVFSHYPYCANLAGQSKKGYLAWNGNLTVDKKVLSMIKALEYELGVISKLNSPKSGVIIHPGSYPDRDLGHKAVAKTINRISFPSSAVLLLENSAGEGNKLCRTIEELGFVLSNINEEQKCHVKVCIDTAHIWGQGDYDLRESSEVERLFSDIDKVVGLKQVHLIHLNDSKAPLGSKKDLHACLGQGHIWKDNFESLLYLLDKCTQLDIPLVLETSSSDLFTLYGLQQKNGK
jgi:deoxyribonuclease IV